MSKSKKGMTNPAPAAPTTVETLEKKSTFEYIVVNIICLFAFLAFGYIAIMGFFQTSVIDPQAYSSERILFETDNLALNLFFTAVFVIFLFIMRRFYNFFAKVNLRVMEIALGVYVLLLGLLWIFAVTSIPAADSANLFETAAQAAEGNYSTLNNNSEFYNHDFYQNFSYYNFYPFQLGYVFLSEIVYRIFGSDSSMPMQVINVIATAAAYVGLALITKQLFKKRSVEFIAILMLAACFQPILFCTFVYGNILGMSLGIWSCYFLIRYFKTHNWKPLIPCGVLLVLSTVAKYNNMIYLIAFVVMLIVHTVKHKKWQSIAFALAICIATVGTSSIIISVYRSKSETGFADGMSQVLYLDMGLQESGRAPGWYTRTGVDIYLRKKFDNDAANKEAWQQIGKRMDEFGQSSGYTMDFFSKKVLSQWNEPTFESIWVSKVKGHTNTLQQGDLCDQVYNRSLGQFLELHFGLYMRVLYVLFAVGIYLMFVRKKTNVATVLLPLIIMGGFGYHFLFEAKSQYVLTYIPLLIPTAAYALQIILLGDYSGLKKVTAKINAIPKGFPFGKGKKAK